MSTSTLPTGTVTLLTADIDEMTICPTEAEHIAVVRARLAHSLAGLVDAHYGVCLGEQDTADGFVVTFAGAGDAVSCAMALHRAAPAPLLLRIGVHTGEIVSPGEDEWPGIAVDRAARLRDLAVGGQTLLTATTGDLVRDALPPDASLIDVDRYRLRALPRAERITQLCHGGFAAATSSRPVRSGGARVVTITPRWLTRC